MKGLVWKALSCLCCSLLLWSISSVSSAAEVCTDRTEFIHFLNEHKLFKQKTKIQAKYIAELKKHIAEQDQGIMMLRNQASSCDVLAEEYARQHALLTQELKDKEFDIWKERGVGFGAGLLIVIGVLIFK